MFDWIGQQLFDFVHRNHLVYAACWEDPAVDCQALQIRSDDNILAITSAGCNVLHYVLEEPNHIFAVDLNYRQNALLELKLSSIRHLEWSDFFAMFGQGKLPGVRQVYRERLRAGLSHQTCEFWDRHIRMFDRSRSFYFQTTSGLSARLCRSYLDRVLRLGPAIDAFLDATDLEQQIQIYETRIRDRFWNRALGFFLQRNAILALSGIPPQQRSQMLLDARPLLERLQCRAEQVIRTLPIDDNYFWRLYLTGKYTESCCPAYLRQDNFERLRSLIDRVTIHTDSVQHFLEQRALKQTGSPISCFVLLDHMDWLTCRRAPQLADEWQAILGSATSDARFVWRSLGVDKEFIDSVHVDVHGHPRSIGQLLDYDYSAMTHLMQEERVSVYGGLFIAKLGTRPDSIY
jgi:S-adenosylmethionine-diacylglycerol 3-amino-3-carboxypropyl transferase